MATVATRSDELLFQVPPEMGARRRRAHRELVGLERAAPEDEEFGGGGPSARASASAHVQARGRAKTKESQREFALLVGACVVVAALVVFLFVEYETHVAHHDA